MRAERAWRSAVRAWDQIPLREPWRVLMPLLAVHWFALVAFTSRVNHNAWLFYQGGDQIWYWTTGWLVGHGSITEPQVSQGWPLFLVPFTWIGGPGFLGGLPGAMLLQVLVLAPIALWCMYEIGARIGGRPVGYIAALVWTVGPYLAVPLFVQRYHDRYVDQFLPLPLGLTAMADQIGVVCLLAAAVFTLRAITNRDPGTAALAGLTAGFAGVVKPSNFIFVFASALALLAARRWRELAVEAVAIAPALAALALWKYRGYGFVPAFTLGETHTALGWDTIQAPYRKYIDIHWDNLGTNIDGLREVFWSVRVLQWLPIAGAVAVARRSLPLALFLTAWFWAFFVLKGSALQSTVDSGSFFRLLMPAVPAFLLLAAALPLLVPTVGERLAGQARALTARAVPRRALVVAAIVLGLAPIVAAATASPLKGPDTVLVESGIATPVGGGVDLSASVHGKTARLDWQSPPTASSRVFYKLYRASAPIDFLCFSRDPGADTCVLRSPVDRITRRTSAVDRPGPGTWTYRVGVAANWLDDPTRGDVFLLSKPVTVTVGG